MGATDQWRRGVLLWARLALGALTSMASARADAAPSKVPVLRLEVPRELHVGEHAQLALWVDLPAHAGVPVLITPYREGEALEIVRGRLLRSDARDPRADPLRFELPVLARAPGTGLIGVRLLAYVCEPQCRAVEVETRANVVVLP